MNLVDKEVHFLNLEREDINQQIVDVNELMKSQNDKIENFRDMTTYVD